MATVYIGDEYNNQVEHRYAPNPTLEDGAWEDKYPPITATCTYLINKFTKELVPNLPEFRLRSDILEPFFGDPNAVTPDAKRVTVASSDTENLTAL